ncbi:MAG: C39 family peptidase [Candidatus Woesearchaeota archaeon]
MPPVLARKVPKEYLKQRRKECGAYVMKAVLSMYGKDGDLPPQAYLSPFSRMLSGYTSPWRIKRVLVDHGLEAAFSWAKPPKRERLSRIKKHLSEGRAVIALIANPYKASRKTSRFRRLTHLHWILILGYDDEKGCVYLYDPQVSEGDREEGLPVGNVSLPYRKFLLFWRGSFFVRFLRYFYMPVDG